MAERSWAREPPWETGNCSCHLLSNNNNNNNITTTQPRTPSQHAGPLARCKAEHDVLLGLGGGGTTAGEQKSKGHEVRSAKGEV